jgi:hypothetical protein
LFYFNTQIFSSRLFLQWKARSPIHKRVIWGAVLSGVEERRPTSQATFPVCLLRGALSHL